MTEQTMNPPVEAGLARGVWLRICLTLAMALPMFGLYAVGVLGPTLSRDLQIAPDSLGLFTLGTFGLAAVLSPWAGPIVDRLGAQRGLVLLFLTVALTYGLMVGMPGFGALVAVGTVGGVAQALCNPVTNLIIAQQVPPAQKAQVVGLKQAGVQLAALFAGLALPAAASHLGWRAVLGGMVPVSLWLAVAAWHLVQPGVRGPAKPWALVRPNPRLSLLMGVQLATGLALSAFVTFLPSFAIARGVSPSEAGALIAAFGLTGWVARVVLTPLGARLREESNLLFVLLVLAAVAVAATRWAEQGQAPLWVASIGMGASAVACNAIAMGMLLRDPALGTPASASGWLSSAFFAGFALGPPLAGWGISVTGGFVAVWSGTSLVLCVGAGAALALARLRRMGRP